MPKLDCNYWVHFTEISRKYRETVELNGDRLNDLINFLDEKYKGFKKELIDPATGKLGTRNVVLIERGEENIRSLFSLNAELREGDILTFF